MPQQKMPVDNSPRNIGGIALHNNDNLAHLYKRSLAILAVQQSIRLKLGTPLARHLYVASLGPECLTIYTDSQVWATTLRFQTAQILEITRKVSGFASLDTVRFKVSPALFTNPATEPSISISPATSRLLTRVADTINDPGLASALLKLSRNI